MSDIEMESVNGEEDDMFTRDVKELLASSDEEGEIRDSEEDDNVDWLKERKKPLKTESSLPKTDLIEEQVNARDHGEALYKSLGIGEENEDRRHARLDTIHMYGTKNMGTNDIFKYFHAHKPLYLEWVNPSSCNIVWADDISAAQALVYYSEEGETYGEPPGKWRIGIQHPKADKILLRFATKCDKKVTGKDKMQVLVKKYKDISVDNEQQAGFVSKSMANQIDNIERSMCGEEKTKNPWGDLCQSWGINDSQEVFGVSNYNSKSIDQSQINNRSGQKSVKDRIGRRPASTVSTSPNREKSNLSLKMRLGKRSPMEPNEDSYSSEEWSEEEEETDSDEEWRSRSKVPRMRMHADDEQDKLDRSKTKRLSDLEDRLDIRIQVDNQTIPRREGTNPKGDLRARLKEKQVDSSGSDEELQTGTSTVWSRLDFPHSRSNTNSNSRLDNLTLSLPRSTLRTPSCRPGFEKDDLRSRLGKKNNTPGSPLRIEIDNEHCIQSNS